MLVLSRTTKIALASGRDLFGLCVVDPHIPPVSARCLLIAAYWAQIGVDDISDVHQNARAEVHLTAYKQRIVPIVHGDVIQVSADRLTDPKTGNPYYTAPGEGG